VQQREYIHKAVSASANAGTVFINRNLFSNYYLGTLLSNEVRKRQGELGARMPERERRRLLHLWERVTPALGPGIPLGRTHQALLEPLLMMLGFEPLERADAASFGELSGEGLPDGYYLYRPPVTQERTTPSQELSTSTQDEAESVARLEHLPGMEGESEEAGESLFNEVTPLELPGAEEEHSVLISLLRWSQDFDRPFPTLKRRSETPAKLMERLLANGPARWGLLLNGQRLRLMKRTVVSGRQHYLEVDLDALCENGESYQFDIFWMLFRAQSFHPGSDGRCLLDIVDDESRQHAMGVSTSLKYSVFSALETLMRALVLRANELVRQEVDAGDTATLRLQATARTALDDLHGLYEQSLVLLYRLLFVLYAESRNLLPIDKPVYRDSYSLEPLRNEIEQPNRSFLPNSFALWETLQSLFRLIRRGCNTSVLVVPAYNGALFDPHRTRYLDGLRISDAALKEILTDLSVTPPTKDRGRERIDYSDLGVEQLGAVYEGLLEFEPRIANEPMVEVRYKDERVVIPEREQRNYTVIRRIARGDFYLGRGAGRKTSGSYYTPQPLVDFLVRRTLEPLVAGRSADEILQLKIVDPAMGSGAFLVGACLYLAEAYARALQREQPERKAPASNEEDAEEIEESGEELDTDVPQQPHEISEEETLPYRRLVAERCLYGVDLNEMAVELARVSLWLITLAGDKPLTFLDANLRCGNSLISAPLIPYRGPSGTEYSIERIHPEALKRLAKARGERLAAGKKRATPERGLWEGIEYGAVAPLIQYRRWIAETPSDNVEQVHAKENFLHNLEENDERLRLKRQCDLWIAAWFWRQPPEDEDKREKDVYYSPPLDGQIYAELISYLKGERQKGMLFDPQPYLAEVVRITREVRPFHWELEFPEAFFNDDGSRREHGGFDAIVANPPWDIIKPNSREFFSAYDPGFRELERAAADEREKELLKEAEISAKWREYEQEISTQVDYFRLGERYPYQSVPVNGKLTGGDVNTYKLFLERAYGLLRPGGDCGIVVPSGLYTDQGCTGLRQLFLERAQINHLVCFENRRGIFPIDSRFKFVLFGFEKKTSSGAFDAAFMLHDLEVLSDLKDVSLSVPTKLIQRLSPDTLSLMEFRAQEDIDIMARLYRQPLLSEIVEGAWKIILAREFHMTDDRYLFNQEGTGWPLYEGKMIHQYTYKYSDPNYWIDPALGRKELARKEIQRVEARMDEIVKPHFPALRHLSRQARIEAFLKENGRGPLTEEDVCVDAEAPRLVLRSIASNTNERTIISTILPAQIFLGNSLNHLAPWLLDAEKALNQPDDINSCYKPALPASVTAYLCGVLNSFTLDYALRFKVSANVNIFYVYQLPVPRLTPNDLHCRAIARRVARLVCVGPEFDELRRELLGDVNAWVIPFEEKEARQQVQNEIDALVAHLYGLSEEDLHHILYAPYTFPLVRREIKDGVMQEFARVERLLLADE
jgi:hypothetical protein